MTNNPSPTARTTKGSKKRKGFGISMSLAWAEIISFWSNWTLVAALVLGVIATYGIVVSGDVKENAAKKEIAEANKRAEEANQKAESERLERLKLEVIVSPRSIPIQQQFAISSVLSVFSGKKVIVETYSMDVESAMLGMQLIACLTAAGIEPINQIASSMVIGSFSVGIFVSGHDENLVRVLTALLAGEGGLSVAAPTVTAEPLGPPMHVKADALVLIGVKPLPIMK